MIRTAGSFYAVMLAAAMATIGCGQAKNSIVGGAGGGSVNTGGADGGADAGGDQEDPRPALLERLAAGEAVWTASGCDTYNYQRYYESLFTSITMTTIQIAGGQPSWRRQWLPGSQQIEWTEGPGEIGSHPAPQIPEDFGSRPPYPASTVAELYDECRQILTASPTEFMFQVTVDDRGMLTWCGKGRRDCVDDCGGGIFIWAFSCGTLDPCVGPKCPGSGPFEYYCWRSNACDSSACVPLEDGTSCGSGTCMSGSCKALGQPISESEASPLLSL